MPGRIQDRISKIRAAIFPRLPPDPYRPVTAIPYANSRFRSVQAIFRPCPPITAAIRVTPFSWYAPT